MHDAAAKEARGQCIFEAAVFNCAEPEQVQMRRSPNPLRDQLFAALAREGCQCHGAVRSPGDKWLNSRNMSWDLLAVDLPCTCTCNEGMHVTCSSGMAC